jgi:asparagine synthase (glutamine-hydrolysing)
MCGIAGILTDSVNADLPDALGRMRRALRHRGPDDEGDAEVALPCGYRLALTHTRLAILDLSPAGHQPMADPESGSWISFNGEIYNHDELRRQLPDVRFTSTCDTETLLKGWVRQGQGALATLRGMFAFALYDGGRRQLWLVRDRLGVKPLYVSRLAENTWAFASEVRALLALDQAGKKLNPEALDAYLAFGAVPAPWTLLRGVESLLPGECWRFDLGGDGPPRPERTRYWRPTFRPSSGPVASWPEAVERVRAALPPAVGLRMVSDVPVGVFLSGGIDSSSIVDTLAALGHGLHTFSVVFGEPDYDESEAARVVARRFQTQHAELFLRPAQLLADYPEALAAFDQPSVDGINTYFISRTVRRADVKVALSGLGGDELFAGYPYFRVLAGLEGPLARPLAWPAYAALRWLAPRSVRTTKLGGLLRAGRSRLSNYLVCRHIMDRDRRAALRPPEAAAEPLPPEVYRELAAATEGLDTVNAQSLLELSLYLANTLLRDTDQMSMAHALEVREPLLDHVLVETVAGLPGPLKLASGREGPTKALLVDALPEELPPEIPRRQKMGFVFPWEEWLRGPLQPFVGERLTDRVALGAAGFDDSAVGKLWQAFLARKPGVRAGDVLCLVHLLDWVRRHGLSLS